LKPEARILVSSCTGRMCLAIVLRGIDVDGAVAGEDCEDLCRRLEQRGYMGEARYSYGDCTCGLPPAPRTRRLEQALEAARRILESPGIR